jgi:hypothetical protein
MRCFKQEVDLKAVAYVFIETWSWYLYYENTN